MSGVEGVNNKWEWIYESALFIMDPFYGAGMTQTGDPTVAGTVTKGPPLIDCQAEAMDSPTPLWAGFIPSVEAHMWGQAAFFPNSNNGAVNSAHAWNYPASSLMMPIGGTTYTEWTIAIVTGQTINDGRQRVIFSLLSSGTGGNQLISMTNVIFFWVMTDPFNSLQFTRNTSDDGLSHRFVMSYDGTTRRVYHNGSLRNSRTHNINWIPGNIRVGGVAKDENSHAGTIQVIVCRGAWDQDQVVEWSADPYGMYEPPIAKFHIPGVPTIERKKPHPPHLQHLGR